MISIIEYKDQYAADFKALNLEWLDKYHLTESHDLMILDDPKGTILDRGGYIWLAILTPDLPPGTSQAPPAGSGQVVGTAALIHEHDNCYELAKMSVAPVFRGKGISKLLIEQCLTKAGEIGAGKLILYSNSQLQTALRLYSQYGFQHVPVTDAPFVTADVKMELVMA
jgi:GNAT superfamily N-acetyltransferase